MWVQIKFCNIIYNVSTPFYHLIQTLVAPLFIKKGMPSFRSTSPPQYQYYVNGPLKTPTVIDS